MSSLERLSPIFACRPDRSIGLHSWLFSAVRRPLRPDPSRLERLCVSGDLLVPGDSAALKSKSRASGGQETRADSSYAINLRVSRRILAFEATSSLPSFAIGNLLVFAQ